MIVDRTGGKWLALLLLSGALLFSHTARGQEFSVMSYNIRFDNPEDGENAWEHRKDFLISQIAYHRPDLLGIQEGLHHQVQAMDKGLADYAYIGRGRDPGTEQGEYSAVFYRTDRLELLSEGTFWLSETPGIPSRGWDAALNRICTYGMFREKESGHRILFFNTHFDHIGAKARSESVKLLLKQARELNPENLPVILAGDLNLEPEALPIKELSLQLEDTRTIASDRAHGPEGTWNGFDLTQAVKRRIDYIFVSPGRFEVLRQLTLSETTGTGYPSDHFAVMATLAWRD